MQSFDMHNAIVALILHCLSSRLIAVLGSMTQSALEAKSGATIGMSHLRHKRIEDLRPNCVIILLHRIPLS